MSERVQDSSPQGASHQAGRRGRSARYPGVPLDEALEFCARIDARGLDGLPAATLAEGLGYSNVRTNTLSARLSSARQFGLMTLENDRYTLTPLARAILHPIDPSQLPRLHREALREPPLYASLASRYAGRRLPDAATLANVLYHQDQITATAKRVAAESFLASVRFAGALGDDGTFQPDGPPAGSPPDAPPALPTEPRNSARPANLETATPSTREPSPVRIDLRLWGPDSGKVIRVRAPESLTPESFDRLLAALRLHIHIEPEASRKAEG